MIKKSYIEEAKCNGYVYIHEKCGAELYYMPAADDDKVFAVGFRTYPNDDTGVAHIVEHTVLSGSEKYPVKELFVNLMRGSMYTYLNAMTSADNTMYTVAAQNDKDFINLVQVYTDSVFAPRLTKSPLSFAQDGWCFAFDEEGTPYYNGVVYNEMKGDMSSPDVRHCLLADRALFGREKNSDSKEKGTISPYAFNSGGDPAVIPALTYEDFKSFYERYYHPSNARLFLYGKVDIDYITSFLDNQYLSHYERKEGIPVPKPVEAKGKVPQYIRAAYPSVDNIHVACMTFLLGASADVIRNREASLLAGVLFNQEAAPVRQILLEGGHCLDLWADVDDSRADTVFSVQLYGVTEEDPKKMEEIILDAIRNVKAESLVESYEATLNNYAFQLREGDAGQYPKGMLFGLPLLTHMERGEEDPFFRLRYEDHLRKLQERVAKGGMNGLAAAFLTQNPYRVTTLLLADEEQLIKEEQEEAERAVTHFALLDEEDKDKAVALSRTLALQQDTPDNPADIAKIPTLTREDLEEAKEIRDAACKTKEGNTLLRYEKEAAGIVYLKIMFPVALPLEDGPVTGLNQIGLQTGVPNKRGIQTTVSNKIGLPPKAVKADLFTLSTAVSLLTEVGTKTQSLEELERRILKTCGGINFFLDFYREDTYLVAKAKMLPGQIEDTLTLLAHILLESEFADSKRVADQLAGYESRIQTDIYDDGTSYAADCVLAAEDTEARHNWAAGGLGYYRNLTALLDRDEEEEKKEMGSIAQFAATLAPSVIECLRKDGLVIAMAGEEKHMDRLEKALPLFLDKMPPDEEKNQLGKERNQLGKEREKLDKDKKRNADTLFFPEKESTDIKKEGYSDSQETTQDKEKAYGGPLAYTMPSPVQYIAMAGRLFGNGPEGGSSLGKGDFPLAEGGLRPVEGKVPYGKYRVLESLLNNGYLWQEIRAKGGAYGAGCMISRDGYLVATSYRDPKGRETIQCLRKMGAYLRDLALSDEEMLANIIGALGAFEQPQTPEKEAMDAVDRYLLGVTAEDKKREREEILSTTAEDMRAAADAVARVFANDNYCIIGSESVVMEDKDAFRIIEKI